jgi:hypothetical protein
LDVFSAEGSISVDLKTIAERLHTQDNRCTADPIFVVYEKRRLYGIDMDYSENIVWIDSYNGGREADEKKTKALERYYERYRQYPDGWTKTAYEDENRFVTVCFTEASAQAYIDKNKHNLERPFIYADSLYRNHEMIFVRNYLMTKRGIWPTIKSAIELWLSATLAKA